MNPGTHVIRLGERAIELGISQTGAAWEFRQPQRAPRALAILHEHGDHLVIELDGAIVRGAVAVEKDRVIVVTNGRRFEFERVRAGGKAKSRSSESAKLRGAIESPMTGTVVEVKCGVGDIVRKGDPLLVVSAMKMEHRLCATCDGRITLVAAEAGGQVEIGQVLVRIHPEEASP